VNRAATATPLVIDPEKLLAGAVMLQAFFSCITFLEPSPYEVLYLLVVPTALLAGLAVTRATMVLILALLVMLVAQVVALFPYVSHRDVDDGMSPSKYVFYTAYVFAGCVLYGTIFAKRTQTRIDAFLKGWVVGCALAGAWAILQYFQVGGMGDHLTDYGRMQGPFKDPNVLGPFCVAGAAALMQSIIFERRWTLVKGVALAVVLTGGVFLSFSRGAWAAALFTFGFVAVSAWLSEPIARPRVTAGALALSLCVASAVPVVMSQPALTEMLEMRTKVTQDYDIGEDGRFGHQKRAIPLLLDAPLGLGPIRFPVYFRLAAHDAYLTAFSDSGWLGGLALIFFAGATSFVALRQAIERSAFRRQAQLLCPIGLSIFIQAFQIDIAHWRWTYPVFAAIWGVEGLRLASRKRAAQFTPAQVVVAAAAR
jgi:O-antigen ligase